MRWVGAILLAIWLWAEGGEHYVVAVNPQLPLLALSPEMLEGLYCGERPVLGGVRAVVINLPHDHPVRRSFEADVLHKGPRAIRRCRLRSHFLGHRPPKVVKSQEAAARFVTRVPNAVAYMSEKVAKAHGLKILFRWEPR